nr:DUF4351 domain-containing protein [Clostridium tyrobutyricum]
MEKGREEVRKSISGSAIKLLTKKFGTLPEDMTERIEKLPIETLKTIIDNIFDLKSLDEVSEYLK